MNREEKRRTTKKLKDKGYSKNDIAAMLAYKEIIKNSIVILEGQRVKLNIELIKSDVNYPRKTDKYKDWIDKHKDDIFTAEYDLRHLDKPNLVCLAEDTTNPRWLIFTGDLTVITVKNNDPIN